jgi:chaperonin GroEL
MRGPQSRTNETAIVEKPADEDDDHGHGHGHHHH